jgi:hypothetical protein
MTLISLNIRTGVVQESVCKPMLYILAHGHSLSYNLRCEEYE